MMMIITRRWTSEEHWLQVRMRSKRSAVCSFKTSKNDHIIEVQLYDDIDFICPHYPAESSTPASEYYTIYMVGGCLYTFLCVPRPINIYISFISDRLVIKRLYALVLWICSFVSVCLSPKSSQNAFFSKTKQSRATVSIDDQQKVLHGLFKEHIIGHLKFKMVDGRHFKNRFWPQLSNRLPDFSKILRGEAVFHSFGNWTDTRVPHCLCNLGFDERRLSYRLRYTCFIIVDLIIS